MTNLDAPDFLPCQADPNLFHQPDGERTGADRDSRITAAQALCAICPVRVACGDIGRALGERGIWGGEDHGDDLTPVTRPVSKKPTGSCGTPSRYKAHLKRGEHCPECVQANADYVREYYHRRRALATAA